MSDTDDEAVEIVDIDVRSWVEAARADPQLHRDRQVTEVVLAAIGLSPSLREGLVLKGGTLMALAFQSKRVTGDVDFSAQADPAGFDDLLRAELDTSLGPAAIQLGYLDLVFRVQGVKRRPRPELFEDADFPALEVRIGSALRNTPQEQLLAEGKAARILLVEISFRDQVYAFQELHLEKPAVGVRAFTLEELIAEKLRALLQQPIRRRNRRQDVYDIAFLLERHALDDAALKRIRHTLVEKCRTRGIDATRASIENPEIRERAEREWGTLKLEISDLGSFDERFENVLALYRALPWQN
jgi:predicted nucleotidyltransferase component of viral defense system